MAAAVALVGWLVHHDRPEPSAAGTPAAHRAARDEQPPQTGSQRPAAQGLPPEALTTLALIRAGGPFPFDQDGTEFRNREGRLPAQARGYYREYTVPTPGAPNRGARRLVAGEAGELFYTDDHYASFRRIDTQPEATAPPR